MPTNIITSIIAWNLPQVDGRSNVREQLTDNLGNVYDFDYMWDKTIDINGHLANTVATMNAQFTYANVNAVPIAQSVVTGIQSQIASLQIQLTTAQAAVLSAQSSPVV